MKFQRVFYLIVLLCGMTSSSWAGTEVATFQEAGSVRPYQHILVSVDSDGVDLKTQKEVEDSLVQLLSRKSSTDFDSELALFSPLKSFSESERADLLSAQKIDAILSIKILAVDQSLRAYTEPVFSPWGDFYGYPFFGFYPQVNREVIYTVWNWSIKTELYDLQREKTVWLAQSDTQGSDRKSMLKNFIKKIAKEFLETDFVDRSS